MKNLKIYKFFASEKRKILYYYLHKNIKSNTNIDLIPVCGKNIRKIRKSLRLSSTKYKDFKDFSSIDIYERNERIPSRKILKNVVNVFDKRIKDIKTIEKPAKIIKKYIDFLESLDIIINTISKNISNEQLKNVN